MPFIHAHGEHTLSTLKIHMYTEGQNTGPLLLLTPPFAFATFAVSPLFHFFLETGIRAKIEVTFHIGQSVNFIRSPVSV